MTLEERVAVLVLAWHRYRAGQPVRESDLVLRRKTNREGDVIGLLDKDQHVTGGIDLGWTKDRKQEVENAEGEAADDDSAEAIEAPSTPPKGGKGKTAPPELTDAELLAQRKNTLARKAADSALDLLPGLRNQYPEVMLLFARGRDFQAFGGDAQIISKTYKMELRKVG